MYSIKVKLTDKTYPVYIGENLISTIDLYKTLKIKHKTKVAVITQEEILKFYLKDINNVFNNIGVKPVFILIPSNENSKSVKTVNNIITELLKNKFNKTSMIVSFGGGVVSDIAGFVAGVYLRGIRYISIPTTLTSQVDSCIGGKTGVNHRLSKNCIGVYYHPSSVLVNVSFLKSLPKRHFYAGISEVIKYALIFDEKLLSLIERNVDEIKNRNVSILERVIFICLYIKSKIIGIDERESNKLRYVLNYGHTVGHALETVTDYKKYVHGEAISIGMVASANISYNLGCLDIDSLKLHIDAIDKFELPCKLPSAYKGKVIEQLEYDKKVYNNKRVFVLLKKIGEPLMVGDISKDILRKSL